MTLRGRAGRLPLPSDMPDGLQDISHFGAVWPEAIQIVPDTAMPEKDMDEILDFASVLMKLVLILLVILMAGSLVIAPDRMLAVAPSMLMLVVPLFVLVTVLDLAGVVQRFSASKLASKKPPHWGLD
ncbi:hypothetical protein [Pseudomonas nicosulfuronedens]